MGVVEGIVVENCGAPLRSHWLCLPCICSLAFIPFSAKLCRSRQHQGEFRFSFEPCRSRSCIRASGTCPLASLSRDMHTGCLISWLGGLASPVFRKAEGRSSHLTLPFVMAHFLRFTSLGTSNPETRPALTCRLRILVLCLCWLCAV